MKYRVGCFTLEYLLEVDMNDPAFKANGANQLHVVHLAFPAVSVAQRGNLHQGEWRVLNEWDGSLGTEGTEHIDHTDTGDHDGVPRVHGNICLSASQRIGTEINCNGFRDAWAIDGKDVAGACREAACPSENIKQALVTADRRDDCVDLSGNGDDLVGRLQQLDGDLRAAIHASINQAAIHQVFCLVKGESADVYDSDERELNRAVETDPQRRRAVIVRVVKMDVDQVTWAELKLTLPWVEDRGIGCDLDWHVG